MKRAFDLFLGIFLCLLLFPLMLVISFLIKSTSSGPIFYTSDRIGINNKVFRMPKFRTMSVNTPELATHLMDNPDEFLIKPGKFLRKSSLDEIPQLFSIVRGDMSFVGPRPALHNQFDLIDLRSSKGIHKLKPGLTGLAQINGRDELSIESKVDFDEEYFKNRSFALDLKILFLTFFKIFSSKNISH